MVGKMSSFTVPLDIRLTASGRTGVLLNEFQYHVGSEESQDVITVPVGFETDFASTPVFAWIIFPPWGRYSKAAVIHDYLYQTRKRTRKEADTIFREAMCVLGVPVWQRTIMYLAVRWFGWLAWNKFTIVITYDCKEEK